MTGNDQLQKADFSSMYTSPDPRAYYESLMPLDYQIPQHGVRIVESVLESLPARAGPPTVLDVCCSYGINAALLRCDLSMTELGEHYRAPEVADLPAGEMIRRDRDFFARHDRGRQSRIVGLDASEPAIDYSVRAGLLDDGWMDDLERAAPSPRLAAGLRDVDLVVCTGGVGYVGEQTFARILAATDDPSRVRVVSFVLRTIDYTPIADTLARFGLVTEELPGQVVRQRRFADQREQDSTVNALLARGVDPTGREADGWHYAQGFISAGVLDGEPSGSGSR